MQVSQEQIEQARSLDLLSYLRQYKPDELVRVGPHTYATKTHGSLRIDESGLWNWFSRSIGGRSALDYLVKVEGRNFVDAVQQLCSGETPVFRSPEPSKIQKDFILPEPDENNYSVYAYLEKRGIHPLIIRECVQRHILFQSSNHGYRNCVFVGMDEKGEPRYGNVRGCLSRYRGDVAGSDKKYGFCLKAEKENTPNLAVFEAPIDAMSVATMNFLSTGNDWKNMHYLSLGGLNYLALDHFLEIHPEIKSVRLCLDRDEPGRQFTQKLRKRYAERGVKVVDIPPPIGKDYNDTLQAVLKSREQEERE